MGSTPDHLNKATSTPAGEVGPFDTAIVVRLVVASIIFAVALILKLLPSFVSILLLLASAGAAGYDIAIEAVNSVEKGEYFATPLIIIVVTVLSFVIGFAAEGAALIILYQIGLILLAYTKDKTKKSALDLLHYQDSETAEKVASLIEQDEALELPIKGMMEHSSGTVLKFAIAFAVLYAIVLPLFTNFTYAVSIHRALMIIIVCTPMCLSPRLSAFAEPVSLAQYSAVLLSWSPQPILPRRFSIRPASSPLKRPDLSASSLTCWTAKPL